jgi:hypothetical protein
MNFKGFKGSGRGLFEVLSQHMPVETEEYHENLTIDSVPSEIRTQNLPNISLAHYDQSLR